MSRIAKAHNLLQSAKDFLKRLVAVNAATGAVNPHLKLTIPILLGDIAGTDTDFVVDDAFEVIGVDIIKRNGAGAANVTTIKKGAAAITNAIAVDTDDALTRAASIIDTGGINVFAKGDTLRVTHTRAAGTSNQLILIHVVMR